VVAGMYWPWLAMILKFAPLQNGPWTVALASGALSLLAMTGLQWLLAKRQTPWPEMKKP
jgi:hypothetical protein